MVELIRELYLYEIILIILGIFFFIVLIRELSNRFSKEKPVKKLISFFVLPVFMIGFPAIQNFEIVTAIFTIRAELKEDQKGNGNKNRLLNAADDWSEAGVNHPRNIILLAEAFRVGGNLDQAEKYVDKVDKILPSNNDVGRLRSRIIVQKNMNHLRANPQDVLAKQNIQNEISRLEKKSELETNDLIILARGNQAIGRMDRAQVYADSLERINPRIQRPF